MQSGLKDTINGKERMTDKGMFKGYTYDSLERQVDGSHYLKYKIQPSKFVIENKLLFPEASVIKYMLRHQDKDGKKDLLKAIHYLEMIKERDYSGTL